MAQVTVELGKLLELTDFKLFDFDYQFDDTNFKEQLEQQIVDYFYDYEIGQETPDMFKRKFKAKWNRIIPYYNKLYNTTLLTYNPLTNQKLTEVLDQLATNSNTQTSDISTSDINTVKNTGTNTTEQHTSNEATSSGTNNSNETDSDYPQQPIAGGSYASGAKTVEDTTSTTENNDGTNDVTLTLNTTISTTDTGTNQGTVTANGTIDTDYTKTIEGVVGITYPELIEKHRSAILRISDRIIEEMKTSFILVY
jgi:hypothetical protein